MKFKWTGFAGAAALLLSGAGATQADSIGEVEGARAKDRAGYYTSRQDREKLRRYGRNDDHRGYGYRDSHYGDNYDDDYGGGGASIYIGPRRYDGPYGY